MVSKEVLMVIHANIGGSLWVSFSSGQMTCANHLSNAREAPLLPIHHTLTPHHIAELTGNLSQVEIHKGMG